MAAVNMIYRRWFVPLIFFSYGENPKSAGERRHKSSKRPDINQANNCHYGSRSPVSSHLLNTSY